MSSRGRRNYPERRTRDQTASQDILPRMRVGNTLPLSAISAPAAVKIAIGPMCDRVTHLGRDNRPLMCEVFTHSMISLNKNELEALRIMWEHGESKPAQIQKRFAWTIDNGTLRSTLVNLVHKKHAARKRQGKAFYYSARVPKTTALETLTRGL